MRLNKRAVGDARALRDIARALVAKGIDPRDQRCLERNAKLLNRKTPPERRNSVDVLQILGPWERGAAPPEDVAVVRWGSSNAESGYANTVGLPSPGLRTIARNTSEC